MNKKMYFELQKNRYTPAELSWCAEQAKKLCKEDAQHILRIAGEVSRLEFLFDLPWDMERTYEIVKFEEPVDWSYMPGDDPEFVYQMNRHRYFICLGQAYAMTGDETYAETFVRLAEDWIDRVPLTEESHALTWREIEAGLRGENWTKAILYFENSPAVTDAFMEKFTESLRAHGEYLAGARRGFQISSNWGVLENHGLLLIALALGEEDWVQLALARLLEEARVQVFPDGVHWEQSCMYHNEVLHCFLEVINALQFSGREVPEGLLDVAAKMAVVNAAWMKPDGCQPLTGDSDETDLRDMLAASAIILARAGRKEAKLLKGCAGEHPDYESIWDLRRAGAKRYEAIRGELPARNDWFLEESGNYYIRSGWGVDAEYLHFRNGCLGGGHGHSDKLHIDVASAGEDVLVDAGRYQYTYHQEGRVWLKSACAHNTILVDGKDYMEYPDSWSTLNIAPELRFPVIRRSGYTLLEGAHAGYLQNGVNVLLVRRLLVLEAGVYLVEDCAYTGEAHTYSRLFHFNNRGKVVYGKDRILYNGERAKMELIFPDGRSELIKEKSRLSRHYNACGENEAARLDTKADGFAAMFAVLASGQEREVLVQMLPVSNPVRGIVLDEKYAEALSIRTDRHAYTVIFRHRDLSGPGDLLEADGCMGIGRILVSADGGEPAVFA